MKYFKFLFFIFLSILYTHSLSAQSISTKLSSKTEVTYAKKMGTVNPLAHSKTKEYSEEKMALSRRDFRKPKNFLTRFPQKIVSQKPEHRGPDKIRQKEIVPSKRRPLETILNIEGLDNGNSPQDPSGDVGVEFYMQGVNATTIGIFSKDGTLLEEFQTNSLWSEFNVIPGGDPIILYDQEAKRWTITEFPFNGNQLLVAISKTEDPRGEYNVYSFSTPRFPDYPKYSIWSNAYCLTTNEGGFSNLHVYFINRQELIEGADNVRILRTSIDGPQSPEQQFIVATPVDWSGASPPPEDSNPIVLSLADATWSQNQADDMINVNSFDIDWESEAVISTLTQIPVSPYDSNPCATSGFGFQCIPQKDGGGLDGLPEIITFQPHYRNFGVYEAVVFTFITDATDQENISGLRWIELRRTTGTQWELYQEGTFAPEDGQHRFMGGIALDGQGNIGMAYNTSSEEDYASIRYTGRLAGDPLGIMTLEEKVAVEGTGAINAGGRFGDYSHITVDPIDNSTFWFTAEYAAGNTSSTRILAFKVAKKDYDLGPTAIIQPQNSSNLSATETVEIVVKNLGLNAISDYKVGYQFEDGPIIEDIISTELNPDETFGHTFAQTIDASGIGSYDLKIFTSYILDNSLLNDTIYTTLEKQAKLDLGVFNINPTVTEVCGTEADITYTLANLGADSITTASVEIILNGEVIENFTYDTGLGITQSVELSSTISNLNNGINTIEIKTSSPNGSSDELPENNSTIKDIDVVADGESITLDLLTDSYPGETSWELRDELGNIVYSSNGTLDGLLEQNLLTNFCLDLEKCYTFIIFDNVGDGLTSFLNPNGSYEIYDENGRVFAGLLNADFGSEESNSFCVDYECNLQADVLVAENTGSIIIEITNGAGPSFQYSIDGGVTFVSSNIFENLSKGNYDVVVMDEYGCSYSVNVEVFGGGTAVKNIQGDAEIKIFPNPTKGIFEINIIGLDSDQLWIPVDIFNAEGKKIQETTVANYSDVYKGTVSLHHYPEGAYFVNFNFGETTHMLRVIKQ